MDGDGDLDIFVGGRVTAGRYPEPATSYVLHNNGDRFSFAQVFPALGLVSGAVFFDYDGDGDPDLALACEWDSIRLFRNDKGNFIEVTEAFGLSQFKGWWNGIAVGDFDGDGRLDLVASTGAATGGRTNRRAWIFRFSSLRRFRRQRHRANANGLSRTVALESHPMAGTESGHGRDSTGGGASARPS